MKRALALVLALVLCLGVLAGCNDEPATPTTTAPTQGNNNPSTNGTTTPEDTKLDFGGWKVTQYMSNDLDYEAEGSYVNTIVEDYLNIDWDIYESDAFQSIHDTMLADGKIPTLIYSNSFVPDTIKATYEDGVYINFYDYVKDGKYPNIAAYLNSEDPLIQADIAKYTLEDGLLVNLPITQTGVANVYGYFYRADLFEKEKLTFATTQDEFYNLLKTLKSKYPSSYPFVLRQLTGAMQQLTDGWGATWGQTSTFTLVGYNGTYFTHDANYKYVAGQVSDSTKEMAQYFVKLTNEGLLHPSSMTADTAKWQEAFASETSFISYDKMDRLPDMLKACSAVQGIRLVGAAPIAMGAHGTDKVKPLAATGYSWIVGNDKKTVENTLKFLDWLYSEEGIEMTNWGIEGESYTVDANGKKALKKDFLDAKGGLNATGLSKASVHGFTNFDVYLSTLDEDLSNSIATVLPYQSGVAQTTITFDEEGKTFNDTYGTAYVNRANAELSKFMLGQRDFSEWEANKTELMTTYKGEELMKLHQAALDKAVGK